MATALEIIQEASRLVGVPVPTSVVGGADTTTQQMLGFLNRGGKELARKKGPQKNGWTVLQRLHQINTVADLEEYDLPDDFEEYVSNTAWNRDTYWRMRGPLTPQRWQEIKSGLILTPQIRPGYRIRRSRTAPTRKCFIDPVPSSTGTRLIIEYLSNGWVANGPNVKNAVTADEDDVLLDMTLMEMTIEWRFLRQKGFAYATQLKEFEDAADRQIATDTGSRSLVLSRRRLPWPPGNVPETGYGGIV